MHKLFIIFFWAPLLCASCRAQQAVSTTKFSRQDTLKGSVTPERAWWDAVHYEITIEPDPATKSLRGSNLITAKTISAGTSMQIDLQQPLYLTGASLEGKPLPYTREGNVYYLDLPAAPAPSSLFRIQVDYAGNPREAVHPPWDGGWIWKQDAAGNPWMSVACQLEGGSVWYPCKDHQSDEPDSAVMHIIAPAGLVAVGNGRLRQTTTLETGKTKYTWAVNNPINNYNIIPYIGKYISWPERFAGENGHLDITYWVLAGHEKKARAQFTQVPQMLKCFEHWFGPYPFYTDGFQLVEAPHLGMEHQSAIAYGNQFANGYLGKDLSGSGWGEKWDFIIVHEGGHEWFGNNITASDVADMWVHEGFTSYSEALFTECLFGKKAGAEYYNAIRKNIRNDIPVIGPYGVHREGSGDMYYKGGALVHMIRQIIDDDEKFRSLLRAMNRDFRLQTTHSQQIEKYISRQSGVDFSRVFDQYLRTTLVPTLEYRQSDGKLQYRWTNCVRGFNMPVRVVVNDAAHWIHPTEAWKSAPINGNTLRIDDNFYATARKI